MSRGTLSLSLIAVAGWALNAGIDIGQGHWVWAAVEAVLSLGFATVTVAGLADAEPAVRTAA